MISPIVMLAIRDASADMSPYVRKTAAHAIPKLYRYVYTSYVSIVLNSNQFFACILSNLIDFNLYSSAFSSPANIIRDNEKYVHEIIKNSKQLRSIEKFKNITVSFNRTTR